MLDRARGLSRRRFSGATVSALVAAAVLATGGVVYGLAGFASRYVGYGAALGVSRVASAVIDMW